LSSLRFGRSPFFFFFLGGNWGGGGGGGGWFWFFFFFLGGLGVGGGWAGGGLFVFGVGGWGVGWGDYLLLLGECPGSLSLTGFWLPTEHLFFGVPRFFPWVPGSLGKQGGGTKILFSSQGGSCIFFPSFGPFGRSFFPKQSFHSPQIFGGGALPLPKKAQPPPLDQRGRLFFPLGKKIVAPLIAVFSFSGTPGLGVDGRFCSPPTKKNRLFLGVPGFASIKTKTQKKKMGPNPNPSGGQLEGGGVGGGGCFFPSLFLLTTTLKKKQWGFADPPSLGKGGPLRGGKKVLFFHGDNLGDFSNTWAPWGGVLGGVGALWESWGLHAQRGPPFAGLGGGFRGVFSDFPPPLFLSFGGFGCEKKKKNPVRRGGGGPQNPGIFQTFLSQGGVWGRFFGGGGGALVFFL